MAETTTLLSIGEFSSLARLSVRMLRHYDAYGVLVPAQVDPVTGRRRYSPAQLEDAAHVRRLRGIGIGVGVSAIPALLAARGTPAWTRALELQREVLAGELSAVQGRLALVTRMLNEGEPTMSITVTRRTVPAEAEVSAPLERVGLAERDCLVARVVGPYARIAEAHTLIGQRLAEKGLAVAGGDDIGARVFNVYLNSPEEVSESELVTEVCVPLA